MPTWSGKERNRDADDSLLRPITNETSRSRFASDSSAGLSTGSRKGSFVYAVEPTEKIGLVREEPRSMEDLEEVKKKRKQGEE